MLLETFDRRINNSTIALPADLGFGDGDSFVLVAHPYRWIEMFRPDVWAPIKDQLLDATLDPGAAAIKRIIIGNASNVEALTNRRLILPLGLLQYSQFDPNRRSAIVIKTKNGGRIVERAMWKSFITIALEGHNFFERYLSPQKLSQSEYQNIAAHLANAAGRRMYREVERLTAELVSVVCGSIVELKQYSKDGGVDVVLHVVNQPGDKPKTIYVQCKAGKQTITVKHIRELIGCVGRDGTSAGILVTASNWSSDAGAEARQSIIPIDIIHVDEFANFVESTWETAIGNFADLSQSSE